MHLSALLQFAISNDFKELSSTQFEISASIMLA